jgi:hypothetical protein
MQAIESVKLREVLKLVSKPRYILGTTYTLSLAFFESAIFQEFSRERLKSCLIISDSLGYHNALTEAAALQGAAQDYMVVRAPISGSFHPKVWLVVGDTEAALLTGSGNLTQAGFMTNAELFDALHFTPDNPPTAELLADLRSFITGLAGMWRPEDHQELLCVETLTQIEQVLASLPVATTHEPNGVRFLHSFQGPLLEQMPAALDAKDLYVAAPYFGDSLEGVGLLATRYPAAKLHLYPAVHSGEATDIPLAHLNKSHPKARVAQLSLPGKKGAFAHLKLYGLALADDTARLYCTSANCTQAAWQGPNVEAGLLRTVPPADLARYFVSANDKLPAGRLQLHRPQDYADALHCWAVDTGAGLDLLMSGDHKPRLPLSDLRFTVRAGSAIATCEKSSLFQTGCRAHIPWTAFEGWQRRRKVAICLEFQARDAHGKPVHTTCLVENRMLLSADPIHRSAWRGALALLDAEGAPELGDIAAIFSLAGDMFDGNLIRLPEVKIPEGQPRPKPEDKVEPPAIAIWPPQPDAHELRKKLGSTAHGQLQWFQNILKSLLQSDAHSNHHNQSEHGHVHLPDDQQDEQEGGKRTAAKTVADTDSSAHTEKTAKRMWDHAYKDYSRLREKLIPLCPTPDKAPNIWPASIFAFLSTMAVFQAARRMAPNLSLGITAELLCDDFLRAMFSSRRQPEDYCRPKGFRYTSDEKFPPLANDLHFTFKLQLHPDLATVILALTIDRRLRDPLLYAVPTGKNQQLDLVCGPQFVPAPDTREACRRIWRRFLFDPKRKAVDASFEKDFNALFNLPSGGTPP